MEGSEVQALLERNEEEGPMFPVVLERFMEERGIESLEELHRRFVESAGMATYPCRGSTAVSPVSFEEFKRHISCEHKFLYGEVMLGLIGAFGLERPRDDKEIAALTLAYVLGRKALPLRAA